MNPGVLKILPLPLRERAFARCFARRAACWPQLFEQAPLTFAANVRMRLLASDVAHASIAFNGFYELDLTREIVRRAPTGGLMVDVGANYGYFSLIWAAYNPRNRVIAFEASPRNVTALRANIERNGFQSRVRVCACAVGVETGRARFSVGPEDQTGWGGFSTVGSDDVEVEVVTLDDALADEPGIDVLKIDVEGADTWVLKGAKRLLLARKVRHVFFEQNRSRMLALGIQENEAIEFLKSCGYSVTRFSGSGGLQEFHATIA